MVSDRKGFFFCREGIELSLLARKWFFKANLSGPFKWNNKTATAKSSILTLQSGDTGGARLTENKYPPNLELEITGYSNMLK